MSSVCSTLPVTKTLTAGNVDCYEGSCHLPCKERHSKICAANIATFKKVSALRQQVVNRARSIGFIETIDKPALIQPFANTRIYDVFGHQL